MKGGANYHLAILRARKWAEMVMFRREIVAVIGELGTVEFGNVQ